MEPDFKAGDFSQLTPSQRVKWCRQMAQEAERFAEDANPSVRAAYVDLAKQWIALADEIERDLAGKI